MTASEIVNRIVLPESQPKDMGFKYDLSETGPHDAPTVTITLTAFPMVYRLRRNMQLELCPAPSLTRFEQPRHSATLPSPTILPLFKHPVRIPTSSPSHRPTSCNPTSSAVGCF
ncbi:hypothetical protein PCANC_06117 [Puccinia coronata f. sp. avenae]|uniref:Uncharacterized protein n=1 Tax=Puccinia coronata f. sp. avenae TaxID=200324 RepID=A0A2N5S3W5_9BASI|nr:hypothetical protein PCASD_23997 [Puccinia coronata f. sp. avenae]PLW17688.1 hypothetical protein PCANC_10881 [Puccinia coronata f. sp. avenae]PLW38376.1 hypothetical protein PCASD_10561 [Puccinia coronata f. sp. avenae]PLW53371.1 hypothetical protein PCANC_06117 [Puccinia coronata f. sp. avenae]